MMLVDARLLGHHHGGLRTAMALAFEHLMREKRLLVDRAAVHVLGLLRGTVFDRTGWAHMCRVLLDCGLLL